MIRQRFLLVIVVVALIIGCGSDVDLIKTVLLSPSKVELLFPEENEQCNTGVIVSENESEVIFDWTDAEVTNGYIIELTNLTTGQRQSFESDSSALPIRLLRGTPYRWRVDTFLNDSQEVTQSDSEAFYNAGPGIQSFIPFPAIAVFPKDGEFLNINDSSITLQWQTSDLDNDIIGYDVYFGTDMDPPLFASEITSNALNDVGVNQGELYYWRITTSDTQGNVSNSQLFSFQVN